MRFTREQNKANEELAQVAPNRRLFYDTSDGWPLMLGKYGQLEHLGHQQLAAFTFSARIFTKLVAIPGVRRHQTGDDEFRVLLAPEAVPAVAQLLRCFRRRRKTGGRAFPRASRAMGATSGAIEPTGARA
jgi:hypothetical protein